MRVVTDFDGDTRICLELPPTSGALAGTVSVECNTGNDRVVVVLPVAWADLPDQDLAATIRTALTA